MRFLFFTLLILGITLKAHTAPPAPQFLEVRRDHAQYEVGQRAYLVITERTRPTGSGFRLRLEARFDGALVDLTAVGNGGFVFSYTSAALTEGPHEFTVRAYLEKRLSGGTWGESDLVETKTERFYSDSTAPVLTLSPMSGTIRTSIPTLTATYSDVGSGIDLNHLRLTIDGIDVKPRAQIDATHAVIQFTVASPLSHGPHTFTAQVTDGTGHTTTATANYSVDLGVIATGYFVGTVFDGAGIALSGATVSTTTARRFAYETRMNPLGVRVNGTTDADGHFKIPFTTPGNYLLTITKPGYTMVTREAAAVLGRDTLIEQASLIATDTRVTAIAAATGGTATNTAGTLSLAVPPNSSNENLQVTLTEYTQGPTLPGPLPELSQFTFANAITNTGATFHSTQIPVFNPPAVMTFFNLLRFPPASELVVGAFNALVGRWLDAGETARVSSDGLSISYQYRDLFSPFRDINQPTMPDPNRIPPRTLLAQGSSKGTPATRAVCPGCRIDLDSGALYEDIDLTSVIRFNKPYGLGLTYNSMSASPTVFVGTSQAPQLAGNPDTFEVRFKFQGSDMRQNFVGAAANTESYQRAVFEAKNADSQFLPTGSYSYDVEINSIYNNNTYASAAYFGAPAGVGLSVIAREPVKLRSSLSSRVVIENQRLSSLGAGWSIKGLERLHTDPEGTVTLTDGGGAIKIFTPLGPPPGATQSIHTLNLQTPPTSITTANGFTYIASCQENRVYQIDTQGHQTIIAGSGTRGFSGDGALAINAALNCPRHVAVAETGGVYIADSGNFRIRRVYADRTIDTIAGNGTTDSGPDGADAKTVGVGRPLFLAEDRLHALHFIVSGNYIRVLTPRGTLQTLAAPTTGYVPVQLNQPTQILFDKFDNPIITDSGNNRIVKLLPQNGNFQVMLGGETQTKTQESPRLTNPRSLSFDSVLKRYFILEAQGRMLVWDGNVGSNPRIVARFGTKALTAFSPETGLVSYENGVLSLGQLSSQKAIHERVEMPWDNFVLARNRIMVAPLTYLSPEGEFSTLIRNADGSFIRTLIGGGRVSYNPQGLITSRQSTNIHETVLYQYDGEGKLIRFLIPGGDVFTFSYDNRGYLSLITDPAGLTTQFTIDSAGDLTRITAPDSSFKTYTYSNDHLLTAATDELNRTTEYQYRWGRIISERLPNGAMRTIEPQALKGLINDIPDHETSAPAITKDDIKARIISAEGRTTTMSFTPQGTPEIVTDRLNHTTIYSYNAQGQAVQTRTHMRRVFVTLYDALGRITQTQNEQGTRTYQYEPIFGKLSRVTFSDGKFIQITYNGAGQPETITDQEGHTTALTYDMYGALIRSINAKNEMTQYENNAITHNRVAETNPKGARTEYTRDTRGLVTAVRTPNAETTQYVFDARSRMTQIIAPNGTTTSHTYFNDGRLQSVRDAKNQVTAYTYNSLGLPSSEVNANGQVEQYFYDNDRNLTRKILRDLTELTYEYDLAGNLINKRANGAVLSTYQYDADNFVTSGATPTNRIDFTYDGLGRKSSERLTFIGGTLPVIAPVTLSYDDLGRRSRLRWDGVGTGSSAVTMQYYYDDASALNQITGTIMGRANNFVSTFDEIKRPRLEVLGYLQSSYSYTNANELDTIHHNLGNTDVLSEYKYTYNMQGLRTAVDEILGPRDVDEGIRVRASNYQYDNLDRLISSTGPDEAFTYDQVGNRTESSQTYDAINKLLTDIQRNYGYTQNNELSQKTEVATNSTHTYTWDHESQNTGIDIREDGINLTKHIEFEYDAFHRRVRKRVTDFEVPARSYTRKYVYEGAKLIAELNNDHSINAAYYLGLDDLPKMMMRDRNNDGTFTSDEVFTITYDALGSVRELVNANGLLIQRHRYYDYGLPIMARYNTTSTDRDFIEIPHSFAGLKLDPETGLLCGVFRCLDPRTGRWLSQDPIGFAGGDPNLYAYALGNPLRYVDPSGLATTVVITYDYGFGSHVAVYTDANGGLLYDPGGSYKSSTRGSGGYFGGDETSLAAYLAYQQKNSGSVQTFTFDTTKAQEGQIQANIIGGLGGNTPGMCAAGVCSVLQGVGPFQDLQSTYFPGSLADQLQKLPGQQSCGK